MTTKCAVLGDPIGHSLSPVIHRAAYDALGLEGWEYDAVLVPAGTLREHLASLDRAQWRGLSLTMPLKREVVGLLDTHDDWVGAAGAANTLVLDPDGSVHGLNTDVTGALSALAGHEPPASAVVLGAGATAAAVLLALAERGLARATLVVREPDRAVETLRVVGHHRPSVDLDVVTLDDVGGVAEGADVLVSTVPVSAQTPDLVAAVAGMPLVFDVVYDPWPTPLAAAATTLDHALVTGLDLLLAQAAGQVTAMTGHRDVPLDAMRQAAEEALAGR